MKASGRSPALSPATPPADARSRAAAWLAAGVLVAVSGAKWEGFVYPNYLASVLFHAAVPALLILWFYPRGTAPLFAKRLSLALLLVYAALCAVSFLWAPEKRLAAAGSLLVLFGVVWAVGLGVVIRTREDVRLVLRGLFVAGTVAAVAGFCYVARYGTTEAVEHVQGHRNYLAIFLLPGILLGVFDLLTPFLARGAGRGEALRWPVAVVLPSVCVMVASQCVVKSWGALMGFVAGLVCLWALRLSWRRRLVLAAAAAALAVCGLLILSVPSVTQRLMKSEQATRWFMWQGAIRMIGDRPILGWGTGMFMTRFADYKPTEPMRYHWLTSITLYPHDELLLVAAEVGLLGLALYLAGFFCAARDHLRWADSRNDAAGKIAAWALFAAFLAMFVHGLVEVALRFWAPSVAFWTLAGLMLAAPGIREGAEGRSRVSRLGRIGVFAGAVALALCAAIAVVACEARAEWLMAGACRDRPITKEQYVAWHSEAARLSRYVPDYFIALRRRANMLHEMSRQDLSRLNEAIGGYEEIERIAPGYGSVRPTLARLYLERARRTAPTNSDAAREDLVRSLEMLKKALRQNPYDAEARILLAQEMMLASPERNLSAALEEARAAVDADPNDVEAQYILGTLLARAGHREEALSALSRAEALCKPGDSVLAAIRNLKEMLAGKTAPMHGGGGER